MNRRARRLVDVISLIGAACVTLAPMAVSLILLSGCAPSSSIKLADDGTYLISAQAAPIRGGAAAAGAAARDDAQKFCAAKGLHALIISTQERDMYQPQTAISLGPSGGFASGGTSAAGNATLRFRCSP